MNTFVSRAFVILLLGNFWVFGLGRTFADDRPPRVIHVDVVALDQPVMINRLGAARPGGMVYALRRDVVSIDGGDILNPGRVRLRDGKRPRPLVLRANVGDQLDIHFENLLYPEAADPQQPRTRWTSVHIAGLQLVNSMADDGSLVGANPMGTNHLESGLVPPGGKTTYQLLADQEGSFFLYSPAADFNGFGQTHLMLGLFGAVNVQPAGAEWYRSQVSQEDLSLATRRDEEGRPIFTPAGQPIIDYDAVYPKSHSRAGIPILRMLNAGNEIVHSDLTAIITGPHHGRFPENDPSPSFAPNPATPDRRQPYREVTVHYHESQDVIQAFPYFYNPTNANTPNVNAGQDSFGINYGIAGIGAEILANRIGVGPSRDCVECKFEEFFLSSWAGGDPSLLVDVPANAPCTTAELEVAAIETRNQATTVDQPDCDAEKGPKATKAYYPDDPSNVYHSYLGDHVKFRILHAGVSVHHVHHHHAHQWLRTPNSDDSHYLDSQAIGPGSTFTLELVYNGSGNRNLTVGDSIFHCHFYPHFASGMWALYRVHDVLETGTPLDQDGRPKRGSRALPDGEIAAGTPIPAVVPIPTIPMPPLPAPVSIVDGQVELLGDGNPGYPFFIPGRAGHRPPHPPYDFAVGADQKPLDGGLPRHLIVGGVITNEQHTPLDFSKDLGQIVAWELPEHGTTSERRAIQYFAQRRHPSYTSEGSNVLWNGRPADFVVNGLPNGPQPGAPFADPAVDDQGNPVAGKFRRYKGASLQVDAVFNKSGWHYPQQRMMALWQDVTNITSNVKPPEPLFFRANSGDVVEFWHANLIPAYFELDDFQVRTPTDLIGQHIHLVKFDVLASDGAANGFNYEDGTFSPEEVRSRINGINANGGLWAPDGRSQKILTPKGIPELGSGPVSDSQEWVGAQATVQRWYVDPLLNNQKVDRTYMTVFTHDHFGPSTHQMAGLYGALLTEPTGSTWTFPDGTLLGGRDDGGPTSSAANILPPEQAESYREFALMFQDLQLAYLPTSKAKADPYVPNSGQYHGWADPTNVINSPHFSQGTNPIPEQPFLVSDFGAGIFSMNYRNEPLPLRVAPSTNNPNADAFAGDLSHAFRSMERYDAAYSTQPAGGSSIDPNQPDSPHRFPVQPISEGMLPHDPYTPLLRAYENDPIQIRAIAGAHTSMHDFTLHGLKWLAEPNAVNSGYRDSQLILLSEHYEMLFTLPRTSSTNGFADYLYSPSASYEGLVNGLWGILRGYREQGQASNLAPLPNNPLGQPPPAVSWHARMPPNLTTNDVSGKTCLRKFNVSAITAAQALGGQTNLVYNSRGLRLTNGFTSSMLQDPNAIIYVNDTNLDLTVSPPQLKHGVKLEPLILRVAAGDFIELTLTVRFTGQEAVFTNLTSASRPASQIPYSNAYFSNMVLTSTSVGLHPQLLAFDVTTDNGANAGLNPIQTINPQNSTREYHWYAGEFAKGADGVETPRPIEFGAVNLLPADPLMHVYRGLFGALVVEPLGSTWSEDPDSHASATVVKSDGSSFREFVLITQDDVDIQYNGSSLYAAGNPLSAFNYRTEPFFYRYGELLSFGKWIPTNIVQPSNWSNLTADDLQGNSSLQTIGFDTHQYVANALGGGDPQTPIFYAPAGMPVRFRLLCPGGIGDNQQVFELAGHRWQEEPYASNSAEIGNNHQSQWTGTTPAFGTTSHFDIVIDSAGGRNRVPGDYLYRSATASQFQVGLWGLLRVASVAHGQVGYPDTVKILEATSSDGRYEVHGVVTTVPANGKRTTTLSLAASGSVNPVTVPVGQDGRWSFRGDEPLPSHLKITSPYGGEATFHRETGSAGIGLIQPRRSMETSTAVKPAKPKRIRGRH